MLTIGSAFDAERGSIPEPIHTTGWRFNRTLAATGIRGSCSLYVLQIWSGLEEANPDDVAQTLAFALLYSGRKRARDSETMMADIVAKRLVEHLNRSGFVVLRRPPGPPPTTPKFRT